MFKKRGTFEKVLMIFIFFFFDILLTGLMGTVKAEPLVWDISLIMPSE
ncbi:hypothetical protein [Holzapfeliella floricola]|nr:hypothetical protein [Holzapfeliella floricola]